MIRAYLGIMQTRLGGGSPGRCDVADDVARLRDPARHGDHAHRERDQARHRAVARAADASTSPSTRDGDDVALVVADTGAGLARRIVRRAASGSPTSASASSSSTASARRSSLEENEPRGFRARIVLPAARPRSVRSLPHSAAERGRADDRHRPTALIAEDEPLMRERLKDKLPRSGRSSPSWPKPRTATRRSRCSTSISPQIAFLDIRMPGATGLDVAAAIGARCHVVFITAYDQYALQGVRGRRRRLPAEAGRDRSPRGDGRAHRAQARDAADRPVGAGRAAALDACTATRAA